MNEIVLYKGRKYRQIYRGQTKFGLRAKLEFTDGTKQFWVDANAVSFPEDALVQTPIAVNSRKVSRPTCAECGRGGRLVEDLEDGLMKHYRCCDIPPGGY